MHADWMTRPALSQNGLKCGDKMFIALPLDTLHTTKQQCGALIEGLSHWMKKGRAMALIKVRSQSQ